ncbi:MAG: xanthine dehydrogenase family protein molybdopterin-binding subunit, partial [bacterium]
MALRGTAVRRREDEPLLRGASNFVADISLLNAAQVYYLTSTVAHADIISINMDDAKSAPGVIDVVTHADLDIGPYPAANPIFDEAMVRPLLASDRVRFVGEPVVAIIA